MSRLENNRNTYLRVSFASSALSHHQLKMDALTAGFQSQASDLRTIAAMSAGSMAFSLTRLSSGAILSNIFRSSTLVRGLSWTSAFLGEVSAFRATNQTLSAQANPESWHNAQAFAETSMDFLLLKSFSSCFRGENFITRHGISGSAMVAGELAREYTGFSERSQKIFSERFAHALVSSIALESSSLLKHRLTQGRLRTLERDIESRFETSRNFSSFLNPSFHPHTLSRMAALGSGLLYSLESFAVPKHSLLHSSAEAGIKILQLGTYVAGGLALGLGLFKLAERFWPRSYPGSEGFPLPPHPINTHTNDFETYRVERVGNFTFYIKDPVGEIKGTAVNFNGSFAGPSAQTDVASYMNEIGLRYMLGVWDGFGDFSEAPPILVGKRFRGRDMGELWDENALAALREITRNNENIFLGGYSLGGAFSLGALDALPEIRSKIKGLIPLGAPGFTAHFFGKAFTPRALFKFHFTLPLASFFIGSKLINRGQSKNYLPADKTNYAMDWKPISALMAVGVVGYRGLQRFVKWTQTNEELPPAFLMDAGISDETVTPESAEIVLKAYQRRYPHLRVEKEEREQFEIERYYNENTLRLMILRTHHGHRIFALPDNLRPEIFGLMRNFMRDLMDS